MKSVLIINLIAALCLSAVSAIAQTAVVTDGDTVELDGDVHRVHGIDAPEFGQTCGTSNWLCGKEATAALEALVSGHSVHCTEKDRDQYGRAISICVANGKDVGAELVRMDLA